MPNAYNFAFSYYAACVLAMITYIPGGLWVGWGSPSLAAPARFCTSTVAGLGVC